MSVGATSGGQGSFGIVGSPDLGTTKTRELVDEGSLSEEAKAALEADTFIIYGKASVEEYDKDNPPQKIQMEAFEDEIDTFLDGGIISRRHKDIPVGDPVESYTLEEPTEVVVADEVLEFDEGDTLETGVHDDELWIVADLRNDSEIARETRMGALTGDLDGFSVTIFCKEWEPTPKGEFVTKIDWHSTTIGGDEHIKNKDSRFGVAEYKALFGEAAPGQPGVAEKAALEILRELPSHMSASEETDSKSFWQRVRDIADQKADEDGEPDEGPESGKADEEQNGAPEEEKGEGSPEEGAETEEKSDEDEEPDEQKASDATAVLEQVKNELGEEQAKVLEDEMEDDEEEEEMSEAEEGELKATPEEYAEAIEEKLEERFITESQLEEKLDGFDAEPDIDLGEKLDDRLGEKLPEGDIATKEDVEEVMKAAEEVLTETVVDAQEKAAEDAAEQTAEKMVTGDTPDPSGGSAQNERDYRAEIKERFGTTGGNN